VWWLIMLAASIFLSMWFAIVLLGTLVRDIIHKLNDERQKDPLTNLLNRRGFYEKAKSVLSYTSQDTYFLLMCDIDHFKQINDQYGHLIGDSILQHVGQIIRENVRDQDLVGRFGGEEFILLLKVKDQYQAYAIAERIRIAIETKRLSVSKISVTASFGLAQIVEQDFIRAIGVADQLLYSAKQSGRNCIGLDCTQMISTALN
ncbi:MAG TPA: GGDEF domain-containing protein, partial [Acinetobacter sp.]|nr:GGDEF domain-containing protein [Acinetobacter sp.]